MLATEAFGKMDFCVFVCCNSDVKAHLEVDASPAVSHGGHGDHASSSRLLQTLQEQARQQEVAQVVHPELDAETVFCPAVGHQTCSTDGFKKTVISSSCYEDRN